MNLNYFTSESVTEGHPDKIADQISDVILDAALSVDICARVACEVLVTTNKVVVAGEISCKEKIDVNDIIRKKIIEIGYDNDDDIGFNGHSCEIINLLQKQSDDIANAVNRSLEERQKLGNLEKKGKEIFDWCW